uniref:Uncharacterized protein n=1 Tax=Strigamia maritima TaxID=126957 RepID=T1J9Q5_STRMM
MGNSHSSQANHTHSHQPYHPAFHREIRNGQIHYPPGPPSSHLEAGIYNPEYKVLPERIPGQKLKITDNGNILQNGGTISGKAPIVVTPLANEAEFLQVLETRRTHVEAINTRMEQNNSRYYSNPDLAKSKQLYDGNHETNTSSAHRKLFKKSKAPPPPMAFPTSSEPGVSRASSFKDPITGTIVKIHPWEQRQETWCIGVPSQMRAAGSMERILEHRDLRQEMHNNGSSPQEWKFYKNSEPRNKHHHKLIPDRHRYAGSIDRQMNEKKFRAKSMDSLQTSGNMETPVSAKLRQSLESLNNCITEPNKLDIHRRLRSSQENVHERRMIERHEDIFRPGSRQSTHSANSLNRQMPSYRHPDDKWGYHLDSKLSNQRHEEIVRPSSRQSAHSSNSLLRQMPTRKHSDNKWGYPVDSKLNVERSSSTSTGRIGSPITKTEMLLHRKDSSPKLYYFGEGDGKLESKSPIINHTNNKEQLVAQRSGSSLSRNIHRLVEDKHGGSWHFEETRLPLNQQDIHNSKVPLSPHQQPESRNPDVNYNGMMTKQQDQLNQNNLQKNLSNSRQRNSYAFEDKRYRYELEQQITNLKPTLELHVENSDEEDINMHLRPTLPKRVPALPRFSPTQAWRSLNLEHITNAQQMRNLASEADIQEDSIRRITRPVAPPRVGNERSADSGISQDAGSPGLANEFELVTAPDKLSDQVKLHSLPHSGNNYKPQKKRSTWTPEEDLTSDFDGGSNEHPITVIGTTPQMISVQPKLMSIKNMFSSKTSTEDEKRGATGAKKMWIKPTDSNASITFTSVRKLKRSSSGVLPAQQEEIDENWSFSRSLPNSLHNGDEGEKNSKEKAKGEVHSSNIAMRRIGSGPIPTSAAQTGLQNRVMSLDSLHIHNHQKTQSLNKKRTKDDLFFKYSPNEHIIYLPEYDAKKIVLTNGSPFQWANGSPLANGSLVANGSPIANGSPTAKGSPKANGSPTDSEEYGNVVYVGYNSKKQKKFKFQSTVRQHERKRLEQQLSQMAEQSEKHREKEKLLVNQVEEEFQKKREREKASICLQLKMLSNSSPNMNKRDDGIEGCESPPPVLLSPTQLYLSTEELYEKPSVDKRQDSGLFSGISKWMRRQQKLEEHHKASRQEPEGAPSPSAQQDGTAKSAIHDHSNQIIVASRSPNGHLETEDRNDVYIRMREHAGKEGSYSASKI